MAMFDDPKKELQRLEEQLLQEEDWFEKELESAKNMIGDAPAQKKPAAPRQNTQVRNYANGYGNEPAPQVRNPEKGSTKKKEPKEKGIRGLVILAVLETLGIVAVVAYWLMYLL